MASLKIFCFGIFFLLHIVVNAQVKHYVGIVGGKVVGPTYTMKYKRWSAVVDAGWLAGFEGGYAALNGLHGVVSKDRGKEKLWVDVGIGVFAQGYVSPSQHQQELARTLNYTTPIGAQFASKMSFEYESLPRWNFGVHINFPILFQWEEGAKKMNFGEFALYTMQISVQYKMR